MKKTTLKIQPAFTIKNKMVAELQKGSQTFKKGSGGGELIALIDEKDLLVKRQITNYTTYGKYGKVIKVACGHQHFLFITEDFKVYGIGNSSHTCLGNNKAITRNNPGLIQFFDKKKLKVKKVSAGVYQSYFITTEDKFYGCGTNSKHEVGVMDHTQGIRTPVLVTDKAIKKVWSGNYAYTVYYQELESGKVIGCGKTAPSSPFVLTDHKNIKDKEVLKIAGGFSIFLFLVRNIEGKTQVYMCKDQNPPIELESLSAYQITNLGMSCHKAIFTTQDNQVIRFNPPNKNVDVIESGLPEISPQQRWYIVSLALYFVIFATDRKNNTSVYQDLRDIYENKILVDCQFSDTSLNAHKTWVECRFKNPFLKIDQLFQELEHVDREELLLWCYGIKLDLSAKNEKFLNSIQVDPKTSVYDDLMALFKDNETKNFNILVKNTDMDDDYDQGEGEDEDEDYFEEIPVHKFILILKSGLFREMFNNVKEQSQHVTDYSRKTVESLEVFIQYLYIDQIVLTADDDPQLVFEELADSKEYYKLNKFSNFDKELEKIKNMKVL
ncbi:btk-binding protein-related [Anaeramoeba flamelloides]|uniref:Btk-binding protein-related n=1 Tax=Anaeramoeba flamelloides TaxID=1746091 RepID=A0ABQ8XG26_9EUKA|nr:btk-binding protein-related [Anaeramoeba flamelloides]